MKLALSWIDPTALRARFDVVVPRTEESLGLESGQEARPGQKRSGLSRGDGTFASTSLRSVGKLSDRLSALIDRLKGQTRARAIFVSDADCLVLAQWNSEPTLAAAATWLAASWNNVGPRLRPMGEGVVAVQLANHSWLILLSSMSQWGQIYLGINVNELAQPLPVRAMQDALTSALKEE